MSTTTGILTGGANNHQTTSEEANAIATDFIAEGIVGAVGNTSGVAPMTGGLAIGAQGTPDMTVAVASGVAYVTGTPTSQNSQNFRVKNSASTNVTISANSSGSTKYDWVYISLSATNLANPNTAGDNVATFTTSRSSSASSDDGTPPTYGYPLAVVTVANGATSITNSMIRDIRTRAAVSAGASSAASTWTDTGYTPGTVTNQGRRGQTLTISNADVTSFLSPGTRLKLARTVTPPTQCTDLESSSTQWWSKSAPSGTIGTMTDNFTFMTWLKLESYGGATEQALIAKWNGTSGFIFGLMGDGTIRIYGDQGANADDQRSVESVQLGEWIHLAATMNCAGNSYTMYINGDAIAIDSIATTATAIVQAGNLEVGSRNGGTTPLDGELAQTAVFNAVLSQSTIQSYMTYGLSGGETNCVFLAKFNGDGNDSSSSANNLTANGGATATTVDSPFNSVEYAIVSDTPTFSTDTTVPVQVPKGYILPTSGGITSMSYSPHYEPYGFPVARQLYDVEMLIQSGQSTSGVVTGTVYNFAGVYLNVPRGRWKITLNASYQFTNTSTTSDNKVGLSTSSSAFNMVDMQDRDYSTGWSTAPLKIFRKFLSKKFYNATATKYYPLAVSSSAVSSIQIRGAYTGSTTGMESSKILAEFDYI